MSPEDKAELEKVYGPLPELTATTDWQYEKVSWPPRVEGITEFEPSDIKGYLSDYFVNQRWKSDPTHGGVLREEVRRRFANVLETTKREMLRRLLRRVMHSKANTLLQKMLGPSVCEYCGSEIFHCLPKCPGWEERDL